MRFWRIWFETASAVAIAILYHDLFDSVWIAGLLATATMAAIGFVLVGVSPRRYGRNHAAGVVAFTAPMVRLLRIVLGPIPGWLVAVGSAVAPTPPTPRRRSSPRSTCATWWTGPTRQTCSRTPRRT